MRAVDRGNIDENLKVVLECSMKNKHVSAEEIARAGMEKLDYDIPTEWSEAGVQEIRILRNNTLRVIYAKNYQDKEVRAAVSQIFNEKYPDYPMNRIEFISEQFEGKLGDRVITRIGTSRCPRTYIGRRW